ncbi:hypothetical protein [Arenicella xantha]|uniref:Capsular polysaccharide biosynthesis protein n=1 Tax=Arenicella xantha TaxID=644221 RepID=A0A395JL32_9GAMM|nr:hypothetical protein [Arenicella xantha]RBP49891.1 capsular polysaccharide biosynthesis protein [Arenicella xantha]
MKKVLILLGDCPGQYVPLMHKIASQLISDGVEVVFAATSPFYERFTNTNCGEVAPIYYLSDYLNNEFDAETLASIEIDYWTAYPTFIRDNYFYGRHRSSWDEYKKIVMFFDEIFAGNRFDVVVSEPPSNSFLYIGYSKAKQVGAEFIGFMPARVEAHVNIFQDPYGEKLLTNSSEVIGASVDYTKPPDYLKPRKGELAFLKTIHRLIRSFNLISLKSHETGKTFLHQLRAYYKKYIWRRIRYRWVSLSDVFVDDIQSPDTINVLFPMHLRPESSTSVLSRYYEYDLELLKNIAFSLPSNARLIVKEHKQALGTRDISFYRYVASLPNTYLLNPNFDLKPNINRFDALVTLTSTAGFEALCAGVPVLQMGRTFYSNYDGVVLVDSFAKLESALRGLEKKLLKPNPQVMHHYMSKCFPGHFNYMHDEVLSDQNVQRLLFPIYSVLKLTGELN